MARLRRKVEEEISAREQMRQGVSAPDIGDVDRHPIAYLSDIRKIAAIFGDHAVDQQNLRPERNEATGNRRADETQASGYHRSRPGIGPKTQVSPLRQTSSLAARSVPRRLV